MNEQNCVLFRLSACNLTSFPSRGRTGWIRNLGLRFCPLLSEEFSLVPAYMSMYLPTSHLDWTLERKLCPLTPRTEAFWGRCVWACTQQQGEVSWKFLVFPSQSGIYFYIAAHAWFGPKQWICSGFFNWSACFGLHSKTTARTTPLMPL